MFPAPLCLFDIDGTLVSGDGSGRRAFEQACLALLGIEAALVGLRLDGMTDPLILEHVFHTHLGRDPRADESEAVLAEYVRRLPDELARARYVVHPGVEEALALLEGRGAAVGLATGNVREGARIKLERGDLWRRFPFGGFGSDARDRGELVRIARRRGEERAGRTLHRHEVLVIGDTPKDIAAAHAADTRCVAVATGAFDVDALRAAGADEVYPTLAEWIATFAD